MRFLVRLLAVILVLFSVASTATAFFGRHRAIVREQYSYSESYGGGIRPFARLVSLRGAGCSGGFAATRSVTRSAGCQGGTFTAPAPRAAGCQGGTFTAPRTVVYPQIAPIPIVPPAVVPKTAPAPSEIKPEVKTAAPPEIVVDALDEVNAKRAARGLRPFLRDPLLTVAARNAAVFRARYRLFGHTTGGMGDFQFLPANARADAAGCAAYPASYGFLACCVYDNYTYAGAWSEPGPDGKMYHHLFVAYSPSSVTDSNSVGVATPTYTPEPIFGSAPQNCPNGQCGVAGYSQPTRSGWRPGRVLFGR